MSETANADAPKGPLRRLYAWMMENARGPACLGGARRVRVRGSVILSHSARRHAVADDARRPPQARSCTGGVVHVLVGDGRHARLRHRRTVLEDAGRLADRRAPHPALGSGSAASQIRAARLSDRRPGLDAGSLQARNHLGRPRQRAVRGVHALFRHHARRCASSCWKVCSSISSATRRACSSSVTWKPC